MNLVSRYAPWLLVAISTLLLTLAGCKDDETPTNGGGGGVVPITDDLFPTTVGHKFTFDGFATAPNSGATIPDPSNSYNTVWTIAANGVPSPIGGTATLIIDSTRGPFGPGGFVVTVARNLLVRKDSLGDFFFTQTIGPFKRAFGIPIDTTAGASDTLISVAVSRPSQGAGTTGQQWTAYDQTFTGSGNVSVRLEIFGQIQAAEMIGDSSGTSTMYNTYRSRTWRKITVGGTVVQNDATTSLIWLAKDIGPIQVRIVEDTENPGHWRTLKSKNF